MEEIDTLIREVDSAIERGTSGGRTRSLSRLTDLLVSGDGHLGQQQIDLFDNVLGRFAETVEDDARADLAGRIAVLRHAPRRIVRTLAFDEAVAVSTPILAGSSQLDEQDLMAAAAHGPSHRLAICRRPVIAERVADVLVTHGERDVHLALADHNGAVLSAASVATLVDRARDDEALQVSLGNRHDLSSEACSQLEALTRDFVRRQIIDAMNATLSQADRGPEGDASPSPGEAPTVRSGRDYRRAATTLRAFAQRRAITEADLLAYAARGQQAEVVCLIAGLLATTVAAAEQLCDDGDLDRLLLVARAQNWSWPTFAALLAQFRGIGPADPRLRAIESRFGLTTAAKAQQLLTSTPFGGSLPRHSRRKVR